jgi:hypothetical protein
MTGVTLKESVAVLPDEEHIGYEARDNYRHGRENVWMRAS